MTKSNFVTYILIITLIAIAIAFIKQKNFIDKKVVDDVKIGKVEVPTKKFNFVHD